MHSFIENPRYPSARSHRFTSAGIALLAFAIVACGGSSSGSNGQAPNLGTTYPADAATGVPLNARLTANFDIAMSPLSATSFTLKQAGTAVAGTVANSGDAMSATFTPSANLSASLPYTATITTAALSAAGAALAADRSWTFTTGTTVDSGPPVVSSTSPAGGATGVAINSKVAATFSKAMDSSSINSTSFSLKQGSTPVSGTVTYGPGTTATFTPAAPLASNQPFTATISTGVKDPQGNALAAAFSWNFTTGATAAKGPAPVLLGTAGNFAILAKTGIDTVPTSAITGDIGVSPIDSTAITHFSLTKVGEYSTSTQVTGRVYAADSTPPTPNNLTTSVSNMEAAYTDAASRPTPDYTNLLTGAIGGQTLAPGLYKWASSVGMASDVVISGGPNDTWIFQMTGDLTMANGVRITLAGGALPKNIFWQVAGKAVIGSTAHFEGILICKTDVTLQTGSSMNGRILSQTAVALQKATVTKPQ